MEGHPIRVLRVLVKHKHQPIRPLKISRDGIPPLEHYIRRSGPSHQNGGGVDVLIRFHEDTVNWETGTIHLAWTERSANTLSFLLSPNCMENLRSLTIHEVDVDHFLPDWQDNNILSLPFLERFTIDAEPRGHLSSPDHNSPSSWRWLWKSIQQAPNRREVVIGSAIGLLSTSFQDMLSHSPVQSLEVRHIQLLPTLPKLERLRLDGLDFDLSHPTPNLALVVATGGMGYPTIRGLTMQSSYDNSHHTLLNLIHPALSAVKTLSLSVYHYTMMQNRWYPLSRRYYRLYAPFFFEYDLAESAGNTLLLDLLGALPTRRCLRRG